MKSDVTTRPVSEEVTEVYLRVCVPSQAPEVGVAPHTALVDVKVQNELAPSPAKVPPVSCSSKLKSGTKKS